MGVVAVRVKGSLMPAVGLLKRGEEGVYADEPHIRSLIAKGYLTLVSEIYSDDDDAPEEAPESATADANEDATESANEDANESATKPKTTRRGKAAAETEAAAETDAPAE